MKNLKILGLVIITLLCSSLAPQLALAEEESMIEEAMAETTKKSSGKMLVFSGGGYLGENVLLDGYKHYKNNFSGQLELRLGLADTAARPDIIFSLNYDYLPLIMPDGLYGMSETISSLNIGAMYCFDAQSKVNFFIGPGLGYYFDTISMDTPASGKLEHEYSFLGANITAGMQVYYKDKFIIIPEIRYHLINEPGSFWATNMTFQVGLNYTFAGMDWNKWRKKF